MTRAKFIHGIQRDASREPRASAHLIMPQRSFGVRMSYDARGLMPLLATNPFAIWHYRTTDSQAVVTAPGYFEAAAERLRVGHLVILQSADAMALLPVQQAGSLGAGLLIGALVTSPQADRSAQTHFGATVTATAVVRTIKIDTISNSSLAVGVLRLGASVSGPSSALSFTLLGSSGAAVSSPVVGTVLAGRVEVEIPAPPIGDGYRVRVTDTDEATLSVISVPFSLAHSGNDAADDHEKPGLLAEDGKMLHAESGSRLLI